MLFDPVDLLLQHPMVGPMAVRVNRHNCDLFLKYGPKIFQLRNIKYNVDHQYYIMGGIYYDEINYALFSYDMLSRFFLDEQYGMFYGVEPFAGDSSQFMNGNANLDYSDSWIDPRQSQQGVDGVWTPDPLPCLS